MKSKLSIMNAISLVAGIAIATFAGYGIVQFTSEMKNRKNQGTAYIGRSEMKVEDGRMTPEMLLAFGRLSDPQLSPDGKHILYGVSYISVEENRSCRNLYICDTDGSNGFALTHSGTGISNARWIDGGKRIAYISGGQIYSAKISVSTDGWILGKPVQLSDIPAGVAEFSISPDGARIMYVSTVKSNVKSPSDMYSDLDKADAICTDDLMYRHWDHWVKEIPHTYVSAFSTSRKGITPASSTDILAHEDGLYELPSEPFGGMEQLSWSPDGRFIAYSCKKLEGKKYAFSTDNEIYIYNVETEGTAVIPMGGGYDTDPVWSPDGSRICWISMERDGYEADRQRLMVAEIDTEMLEAVTAGPGLAGRARWLIGISEITDGFKYNAAGPVWNGNEIYFNALAEGIQGIFKASANDGTWSIERITDDNLWYDFNSPFGFVENGAGTTLLSSYCSLNFPTELVAVSTENGKTALKQLTQENSHLLAQIKEPVTEARQVRTVDGKDMLTWVLYPSDFDPSRKFPAIEILLGGPQGTISQSWSYRWNYRLMADQGYIVVLPNRRGTTAFGQEWTEQISGDYCGLNMQDYLSAAKEIKSEPYVDKLAACGASYGGYSVYYLCGVHGNTYDAFIAHAGIFNEEHMYMTTEEMWFPNWDNGGVPDQCRFDDGVGTENGPVGPAGDGVTFGGILQSGSPWSTKAKTVRHYANSPHKLVTNWHTPLMVIHGGIDFRVPVDEGMAAYNAAQMMGVPSKLLIFPDENHWILKPQNALLWHREYFRWLDRWCK
ncbi:MAG: S9 family peptidase [Bacteroidales bacterium]|nr:S9 family peptidase [Bacteroidales bacterium]